MIRSDGFETENIKRVACFYRVSTKQQVTEDDIPMQRNACMEFIKSRPDWCFSREYLEKGVSGYKIKASDREMMEILKEDARQKQFDVILVFLFDRLGRMEEETPYVVKWFIDQGIEMWSVKEGQRLLENHNDHLMNYITFWQAEGESKKIQQRTLEAKKQMIQAGKFLGCTAPYGYQHISTGEHNAKGREIRVLCLLEAEAEVVKQIFALATERGFGARRIARDLNENGIPTKSGNAQWAGSTVLGILKNSIYCGYYTYGRYTAQNGKRRYRNQSDCERSEVFHPELVMIEDQQWKTAQTLIASRSAGGRNRIRATKGPLLFSGYAYCGDCGSALTLHYAYGRSGSKEHSNTKIRRAYYTCYAGENGQHNCRRKYYDAHRLEGAILSELSNYLTGLGEMEIQKELAAAYHNKISKIDKKIKSENEELAVLQKNETLLRAELIKSLSGASEYAKRILNDMILDVNDQIEYHKKELFHLREEKEEQSVMVHCEEKALRILPLWQEEFSCLEQEQKKMLLPKVIERIDVKEGEIRIKLKLSYEAFITR